ncbi:hypothetical protein Cni_G18714 [Canna indica]|uniref:Uncharacterized protein n=1 Tax=Canna indica TaxID=4628 RepID=A0AAQ3QJ14_9LILI|nr:hypothetical protein Cni_G18714 [Canna indica]
MVSSSSSAEHVDNDHEIFMGHGKEDGGDASIIVLSGENKGAVAKAPNQLLQRMVDDTHGVVRADDGLVGAFANSNYQAVNNSVVFGGSCIVEDPGVHIAICDDGGDVNPTEGEDSEEEEIEEGELRGTDE